MVATRANQDGGKDTSGLQPAPTIASNQLAPDLQPQPHFDASPSRSIPPPELIAPAPKVEPPSGSKLSPESEAVRNALHSYEDAYASMDIGVLQTVWPSLSKDQVKRLKDGFRGAQAVKVNLEKCGDVSLSGDTALIKCEQSMVYTRDGRRQPPQTVAVAILLRKAVSGNWLVDKVQ
jgi:hypothetical protein